MVSLKDTFLQYLESRKMATRQIADKYLKSREGYCHRSGLKYFFFPLNRDCICDLGVSVSALCALFAGFVPYMRVPLLSWYAFCRSVSVVRLVLKEK